MKKNNLLSIILFVLLLAGIAVNFWKRETILTNETITGSYLGINVGGGVNIAILERFNLAPELRGALFDLSYTKIRVSIQYMLK